MPRQKVSILSSLTKSAAERKAEQEQMQEESQVSALFDALTQRTAQPDVPLGGLQEGTGQQFALPQLSKTGVREGVPVEDPEVLRNLLSGVTPEQRGAFAIESLTAGQKGKRKTLADASGVQRFVDTGEKVFPDTKGKSFSASKRMDEIALTFGDGSKTYGDWDVDTRKQIRKLNTDEILKEASLRGGISFEKDQTKLRRDLKSTRVLVDSLSGMARKIITAKDWTGVIPQKVKLSVGRWTKANTIAAAYSDMKNMFTGVVARTLGGERGVLTDRDIARVVKGMPAEGDTKEIMEFKLGLIDLILTTAEAGTAMRLGDLDAPYTESTNRLQELIGQLESGVSEESDIPPINANIDDMDDATFARWNKFHFGGK